MNYRSYFMALEDAKWILNRGWSEKLVSLAVFISCNRSVCAAVNDDTCSVQPSLLPSEKFSEHSQWLFFTRVIIPQYCLSHWCLFQLKIWFESRNMIFGCSCNEFPLLGLFRYWTMFIRAVFNSEDFIDSCGRHGRLCRWFFSISSIIHYLQVGAIKCPEKAPRAHRSSPGINCSLC